MINDTGIIRETVLALSEPFAIEPHPYARVAKRLGIGEKELMSRIAALQHHGLIRRLGMVYGHFKVGYTVNALVVWQVPESRIEKVGKIFFKVPAVTHCYARESYPHWPYNLYTMVHARSKKECWDVIQMMVKKSGVKEYKALNTVKEFKKIRTDLREIL